MAERLELVNSRKKEYDYTSEQKMNYRMKNKRDRYFDPVQESGVKNEYDPSKRIKRSISSDYNNQRSQTTEQPEKDKKLIDLVAYYEKILQTLKTIPKEDTEIFVSNALQESKDYEVKLSTHRSSSHCIELLLSICKDSDVWIQFMTAFATEKIEVCTNAFASHISELLLNIALQNIQDWSSIMEAEEDNAEKKNTSFYITWITEFGDFIVEHFESCLQDPYASHVTCTIIRTLGGDTSEASSFISKRYANHKKDFRQQYVGENDAKINECIAPVVLDNVPKFFTRVLKKLSKSLLKIDAITDYVTESSSAAVIETLLCILKKRIPKRSKKLVLRLSAKIFSEKNNVGVPFAFLDRNCSFVVENMFRAADEEVQHNLWNEYFAECLEPLIEHSFGNYIVQKLFDVVESQSLFEVMSEKIGSLFEKILSSRHYGIFLSIAGACNRLKIQQAQFMKNIMRCLQCAEPEERQKRLVPLLLGFRVFDQDKGIICLQGSLLAQSILKYQKPIKVVTSLLNMKPQELSHLACHIQGCHVLNSFFSSASVGEKNKDKLIQCLKPCLINLACDRNGSMTLARLWVLLTIKQKSVVAQTFTQDESTLQSNKNGNLMLKKFGIYHYKNNYEKWKKIQNELTHSKNLNVKCK